MFSGIKKGVLFISVGILCFLAAAMLVMFFSGRAGNEVPTVVAGPLPGSAGISAAAPEIKEPQLQHWIIYITGEVAHPGVHEVNAGSRVNDAVKAAGGLLPGADRIAINLAEKITDGSHIHIPEKSTQKEGAAGVSHIQQQSIPTVNSSIVERKTSHAGNAESPGRIDINRADRNALQKLPGIGPVTAEKIINYRQEHGVFSGVNDLIRIKGIGEKKLEQIRPLVFAGS